jgi:hypothetical protein
MHLSRTSAWQIAFDRAYNAAWALLINKLPSLSGVLTAKTPYPIIENSYNNHIVSIRKAFYCSGL